MRLADRGAREAGHARPLFDDGGPEAAVLVARLTELLRELRTVRHDSPPWLDASLMRAVEGVGDSLTILVLRARIATEQSRTQRRRPTLTDELLRKQHREEAL